MATSKPEHFAVPIVDHLGMAAYFETVGGDELDGSLPTKALVIDKVLARLGRPDPVDVIMVGDRSHDVQGARAHGIDCGRRRVGLCGAGGAGRGRHRSRSVRRAADLAQAPRTGRCACCKRPEAEPLRSARFLTLDVAAVAAPQPGVHAVVPHPLLALPAVQAA